MGDFDAVASGMKRAEDLETVSDAMRPHVQRVLDGEYALPREYRLPNAGPIKVLDLGANVGAFSLWALAQWPEADISAYEPCPENFEALRKNLKGHGAHTYHIAIGGCDLEEVTFRRGANNNGECSRFDLGEQAPDDYFVVEQWDACMLPDADVIKIDTEGCELEILAEIPLERCAMLALEWHRTDDVPQILQSVAALAPHLRLLRRSAEPGCSARGVMVFGDLSRLERVPDPPRKKVFLAMPVYGGYDPHFVTSLMELVRRPPFEMVVHPVIGDSLVSRARNRAAAKFLASDCTHFLFLDTDLIFSVEHLARLVGHDEPIVAGLYPKKQVETAWVCNLIEGHDGSPDERGLVPVRYAGTGCLLVAREVFFRMIEAHPEIAYDPDSGDEPGEKWDLFPVGVFQRRYLSEDWFFCQRALDLGYTVWMDPSVILKHVGSAIYPIEKPEAWAEKRS